MTDETTLVVRNFAQIEEVNLSFGDLSVLVGAQATGKSLALQWMKTAIDGRQIVSALRDAGQDVRDPKVLVDLIFGVGMAAAWRSDSKVIFNGNEIRPAEIHKIGNGKEKAFFIPAHRSILISDGWAAPFQKLTSDTPVVARIFSQNLFERFSARGSGDLFPLPRVLKGQYREIIDSAVFHGGVIGLEQDRQHAKRLRLKYGESQLPFMTWTAGQREFTPLLLGLYHLLPPRRLVKQPEIDWVIIEEPELGLHPEAVTAFLLLTLDLLWRGYRVVLSTHSPHVLTAIWMLRRLRQHNARWQLLCDAFDVRRSQDFQKVAEAALHKSYRVHLLEFGPDGKVRSSDISNLDPEASDEGESGWGGLTGFSSRFGDAVRKAVNESGR
ncbi:MAG: AAA family ATPase [Acidobacteriota bacterium]